MVDQGLHFPPPMVGGGKFALWGGSKMGHGGEVYPPHGAYPWGGSWRKLPPPWSLPLGGKLDCRIFLPPHGGGEVTPKIAENPLPPHHGGEVVWSHGGEVEYRGGEVELVNFASPPWWGGRILDNLALPPHGANPGGGSFWNTAPPRHGGEVQPLGRSLGFPP